MAVMNYATLIRRELLTTISRLIFEGRLVADIDKVPVWMRPKKGDISRCCVYKDRAMLKYKLMALLGFDIQDEIEEEITPLSEYARRAISRTIVSELPLTVVGEACIACVKVSYVVTNMCRGCVARSCMSSCNKKAISFVNGKAEIDSSKCVNCGLCKNNCPYHAIIYTPVPCEESCPVGAISKDNDGIEHIDDSKCIYCGHCVVTCPFGAIMEKSHLVEVLKAIKRSERKVIAMVAPAIAGQFKASLSSTLSAIKQVGFDRVVEVAKGADVTTTNEAKEFIETLNEGRTFMTTSCCPSYTSCVDKYVPELKPYVSHTKTPLYYTAELMRKKEPDAILVFVGPCLAKRYETLHNKNIDYMISFEEIGAMMLAKNIDINQSETDGFILDDNIKPSSRGYAVNGGVAEAVIKEVNNVVTVVPQSINGFDKSIVKTLKGIVSKPNGNLIEVMGCEGGCVNGCNVIANTKIASRQVKELSKYE